MNPVGKLDPTKATKIQGGTHPTADGMIDKAHRNAEDRGLYLVGSETEIIEVPTAANNNTCIVKVTGKFKQLPPEDQSIPYDPSFIFTYSAIGDANPANCSGGVSIHFIRMAETRATGRMMALALNVAGALEEELTQGTVAYTNPNAGGGGGTYTAPAGGTAPAGAAGSRPWDGVIPFGNDKGKHISDPAVTIKTLEWIQTWTLPDRVTPDTVRREMAAAELARRHAATSGPPPAAPVGTYAAPNVVASTWKLDSAGIQALNTSLTASGKTMAEAVAIANSSFGKSSLLTLSKDEYNMVLATLGLPMIS